MAYRSVRFQIRGVTPLMMHSIRLANPLDPAAKAIKAVAGKRKKTDEDHEELARLEFLGSLYTSDSGEYIIPAPAWEACIVEAAKVTKQGKIAKSAVFIADDTELEYAGPRAPDARFADPSCVDYRAVRVQAARLMRCRPIFRAWSCTLHVAHEPRLVDEATLRAWLETAGRQVGILEYRPRFGRFEVG